MKRTIILSFIFLLLVHLLLAQTVTTILQNGSGIDESLFRTDNGELYGTGYVNGTLSTFTVGSSYPVLDSLDNPSEMAELSNGVIAITESQGNRVILFDPQSQTKQLLTGALPNPAGIIKLLDSDTLLVSSTSANSVYRVAPNGDTSLYLTGNLFNSPVSLLWDDSNNLYIANYSSGMIVKKESNGSLIPFCTLPTSSLGHMVKVGNMIYATGVFNHKIFKINLANAEWNIYAGSTQGSIDGDLSIAQFNSPNGIAASVTGDSIYISEYNTQSIRLISGVLSTLGQNEGSHQIDANLIKIWPNPVQKSFYIHPGDKIEPFHLQLFDLNGIVISNDLVAQKRSGNVINVCLPGNLSDGLYFLQVISNSMSHTQKIIISNE